MTSVTVGVEGRRSTVGCQRRGGPIPSLQRLLLSVLVARVYRGTVGTANVGSCAPTCPPFIVALRERGLTAIHGRRPRSGRGSDQFPDPEITFLTFSSLISISHLYLDNPFIRKLVHRAHCIMTVS
jgi:hypothetical protein